MDRPDASTALAGVVGHPVGHSLSPQIHNAALRRDGRNAVYLAFDVRPGSLAAAIGGLRALGAAGVNVTIPHKTEAVTLADAQAEVVRRVGAANVLVFDDGVRAENTDVPGIRRGVADLGVDPAGLVCLVIGAGGSARAAACALLDAGCERVQVANRTPERAEALVAAGLSVTPIRWDALEDAVAGAGLIVHATSVGLGGDGSVVGEGALKAAAAADCRGVLDLVYGPQETALVRAARVAGLPASDGLGVLVHQAALTYELLWGAPAPLQVMRDAAARSRAGERPTAG